MRYEYKAILETFEEYASSNDGFIAVLCKYILETQELYYSFLDEIKELYGIKSFNPWDYLYIINKYMSYENKFQDLFSTTKAIDILESSISHLGFSFQELGVAVFYKEKIDDLSSLKGISIPIFFVSDKNKKQFGRCKRAQSIGFFRTHVNIYKDGIESYRILFHEFGHALHFRHIDSTIYSSLQKNTDSSLNEALAQIIETLIYDLTWLNLQMNIDESEAKLVKRNRAISELLILRGTALSFLFEFMVSSKPEWLNERDQIWSTISKTILYPDSNDFLPYPSRRNDYKIVFHSFGSVDEILSVFLREQIKQYIMSKNGTLYCNIKEDLIKFYKPGGSVTVDDLLIDITGEKLLSTHFNNYLKKSIML